MEIQELVELIESIDDAEGMYLLIPLNDAAGFFSSNGNVLFVAKDNTSCVPVGVETDYLQLQIHIRISAVKNDQTFEDGYYNVISYKGAFNDDNASSFVNLCEIYANNMDELGFKGFFYSLIKLFQLPSEQNYKNAVGFYGELKLMQYMQQQYSIDMSISWHRSGSFSQYDFSGKNVCLEVKTTSSDDKRILIKHQQIFNNNLCYLAVVHCSLFDGGETIEEVLDSMMNENGAFKCLNFALNVAKELKKILPKDVKGIRFKTNCIEVYAASAINPFPDIPDNISSLTYRLDVEECCSLSSSDIIEVLNIMIR